MKTRLSFVTNSSSSCFVLDKGNLSEQQIRMIRDHMRYAEIYCMDVKRGNIEHSVDLAFVGEGYEWHITETRDLITLDTSMDNFDMEAFLKGVLQISDDAILDYEPGGS